MRSLIAAVVVLMSLVSANCQQLTAQPSQGLTTQSFPNYVKSAPIQSPLTGSEMVPLALAPTGSCQGVICQTTTSAIAALSGSNLLNTANTWLLLQSFSSGISLGGKTATALSGNSTTLQTVSGPVINGGCASGDSNGNIVWGAGPCISSSSGVTAGTSGQAGYYASNGSVISGTSVGALTYQSTGGNTNRTGSNRANDHGINILDFGADPTGVSDSTAAIQSAIDYSYTSGNYVTYCPAGAYKTSYPLFLDAPNNLRGGGAWTVNALTNYQSGSIVTYNSSVWALPGINSTSRLTQFPDLSGLNTPPPFFVVDAGAPGEPYFDGLGWDVAYQITNSTASVTYNPSWPTASDAMAVVATFKGSGIGTPTVIAKVGGNRGSPFSMFTAADAPAGVTIIVPIRLNILGVGSVTSVVDSAGNTYTRAVAQPSTASIVGGEIWYSQNTLHDLPQGGSVTVTFTGSNVAMGQVITVSGLSGGVDKTGTFQNASSNSPSVSTGALSQAVELVIGSYGCCSLTAKTFPLTQSSGFTTTFPSAWVQNAAWNSGVTYNKGDTVTREGIPWTSLQNTNLNHDPQSDMGTGALVWWQPSMNAMTLFQFAMTFRGETGQPSGDAGSTNSTDAGCQIFTTFNNTFAFVVGTGNGMTVENTSVLAPFAAFRCGMPTTGAGFLGTSGPAGPNRTLYVNDNATSYWAGFVIGSFGNTTFAGFSDLGAENKYINPHVGNSCVGFSNVGSQAFINYIIGASVSANIGIQMCCSNGMSVYGGNWSVGDDTPATSFAVTISSVNLTDPNNPVVTGTISSPDGNLTHSCTAPVITANAINLLTGFPDCWRNIYNAWTVFLTDYGLVPLVMVAYNSSTHVATWRPLSQWLNPYNDTFGSLPTGSAGDWDQELLGATTIYAAEFLQTFVGSGFTVDQIHIETNGPNSVINAAAGIGGSRASSFRDVYYNSDVAQTNSGNPLASAHTTAKFYAQQAFPWIDMSQANDNVTIDQMTATGGNVDNNIIDYQANPTANGDQGRLTVRGIITEAINFRSGTFSSGPKFTNNYLNLDSPSLGNGDWDNWPTYSPYLNVNTGSNVGSPVPNNRQGWNRAPFHGVRPAPWTNPCVTPRQLAVLEGALPAITGPGTWTAAYPLLWSGQQYKVCDWTLTASAYNAGTTYSQGNLVTSAGTKYFSLVNSNTGNTPASSPTFWAPFHYTVVPDHGVGFSYGQNITSSIVAGLSWSMRNNSPFLMFSNTDIGLLFPGQQLVLTYTGSGCSGTEHFIIREVHYLLHYVALMRAEADDPISIPQGGNAAGTCTNTTLGQTAFSFTNLN